MMSFKGVAYLSSRWIRRQPIWIIQSILYMLGFTVIMYFWGGAEGLRNMVVAWLIMSGWNTGINVISQDIGWNRISRILFMYIASPLTPFSYILGVFLSGMIFLLAGVAAIGVISMIMGFLKELVIGLIVSMPLTFISILVGITIVMRLREGTNVSAVTNPISSIFSVLPPVLYPANIIPETIKLGLITVPLRKIALLVPTASAAEIARQLSGICVSEPLWYVIAVFICWVVVSIVLAKKTLKWGHE